MSKSDAIVRALLENEDDYLIPKMQGQLVRNKLRSFLAPKHGRTLGWGVNPEGNMEISVGVPDDSLLLQVKELLQSLGLTVLSAHRLKHTYNHPVREPGVFLTAATFTIDGKDILHDDAWQTLAANPLTGGADGESF